jgi:hypothetical protein
MSAENIKEVVKEKYGQAALRVIQGRSSCCGTVPPVDDRCGVQRRLGRDSGEIGG